MQMKFRQWVGVTLITVTLAVSGCQSPRWFKPAAPAIPTALQPAPTADAVVATIRQNTQGLCEICGLLQSIVLA